MAGLDDISEQINKAMEAVQQKAQEVAKDTVERVRKAAEAGEKVGDRLTAGDDPRDIARDSAKAAKEYASEKASEAAKRAGEAAQVASEAAAKAAQHLNDTAKKTGAKQRAEDLKAQAYTFAAEHDLGGKAEAIRESVKERRENALHLAQEAKEDLDRGFNHPDVTRDAFMLKGDLADQGYDWWWQNFTGHNAKTGEEKSFFIEFFAINPGLAGDKPILGQLEENQRNHVLPSYLMVKVGTWGKDASQLHRFFGWNEVKIPDSVPFNITADNCYLSESRTLGRVTVSEEDVRNHPEWMSDAGDMIWDLHIDKQVAFNVGYGAGKAMRDLDAFQMFWHAEGMKTAFEGRVYWNGELYMVRPETSYGYADKNWGSDFTSPWIWLSSNNLTSNLTGKKLSDSVFDIGGGRPKVGPVALDDVLLGAMWYEGEPFEFNFSHMWTLPKTSFKVKVGKTKVHWKVLQETPMYKMYTDITCPKDEMLLINYEAPNGTRKHKQLWNGGTGEGQIRLYRKVLKKHDFEWELVDDITAKNVGCEYGEYAKEDAAKK